MRLSVMLAFSALAFAVAGCDRAVPPPEQGEPGVIGEKAGPADGAGPSAIDAVAGGDLTLRSQDGRSAKLTRSYAGESAPDAAFTGADGRKLKLSDFSGRPLLVNIWATWCAPCKHEMPALDRLAAKQAGKISVIAISQDIKGRAPVRAFFDSAGITNLEGYNDRPNLISKALAPSLPLPATIFFDSDGREIWRVIGAADWDSDELAALLDGAE